MKKKRILFFASLCILLTFLTGVVAFAGNDTPTIPICKHTTYYYETEIEATCTTAGKEIKKCKKCNKVLERYDIDALGHMFRFDSCISENEVELYCPHCENYYDVTPQELMSYWDVRFLNEAPNRTGSDNSGYLDLDGNGIINAKDYSIIVKAANGGF